MARRTQRDAAAVEKLAIAETLLARLVADIGYHPFDHPDDRRLVKVPVPFALKLVDVWGKVSEALDDIS